jgi:hypothetical protein
MENVSGTGALIRTELGICPAPAIVVEPLVPYPGLAQRELAASVVRAVDGEMAVEWNELGSASVSALLTDTMLTSCANRSGHAPTLGRVPFCALAPVTALKPPRDTPAATPAAQLA